MERLDIILRDLSFTQYESEALITLIRYSILDAKGIYENSGVPQPKIYETMIKLQKRGLINIISDGRKKVYEIKPKEIVQEYLLEHARQIRAGANIIDDIYNTEETLDIPFIGFAGLENIQDYFYSIVDTAKKSVISFISPIHFDDRIISLLKKRKSELEIKLIFHNKKDLETVKEKLKEFEIYVLKVPAFDIIKNFLENLSNFSKVINIPQEVYNSTPYSMMKKIGSQLREIFGLVVVDKKKSLFKIPLPVDLPMAILSNLPQIVKFHTDGIEAILAASNILKP